jgi:hypothetical protein
MMVKTVIVDPELVLRSNFKLCCSVVLIHMRYIFILYLTMLSVAQIKQR